MGETARGLIPRPSQGVDLTRVNLTAEEGFVWSRVDGLLSLDELCVVTGLGREKTRQILEHLATLGLIVIDETEAQTGQAGPTEGGNDKKTTGGPIRRPAPVESASDTATGPMAREDFPPSGRAPSNQDHSDVLAATDTDGDHFEPSSEVELSEDLQRTIWEFHQSLDRLDFYAVLGVSPEADSKKIDRAYKLRSLKFHPDRYYGKELGPYRAKLEEIFRFLTEVRNFLLDPEKRRAYDENLAADRALKEQITEEMAREQEILSTGVDSPDKTGTDETRLHHSPRGEHSDRRPRKAYRARTSRLRLKALASVLGMDESAPPEPKPAATQPPRPGPRRKHTSRMFRLAANGPERMAKAKKFYDEGIKKLLDDNFVGAATSLKLALSFDPNNEEYKKKYEVASNRAKELMAERFYKQARFQESVGRWKTAASLYVRAADHYPIAEYLAKAASALLMTEDIRTAQEYAAKGVQLDPQNAEARITLAKVYIEAGLPRNARRELEEALQIDPENELARTMLRDLRKRK